MVGCSLTLYKMSCEPIYPSRSLCIVLLQCITIWKAIFSHVSMKGDIQSTYSDSVVFTELFVTGTTKALRGPQRLSSVLRWVCPPPQNTGSPFFFFCGRLNWHKEAMWAAAESSSHQGIGRSEKKMLISMWEQQECPGIMKDCVKFSLEEPLSGEKCPTYSKRSCGETQTTHIS